MSTNSRRYNLTDSTNERIPRRLIEELRGEDGKAVSTAELAKRIGMVEVADFHCNDQACPHHSTFRRTAFAEDLRPFLLEMEAAGVIERAPISTRRATQWAAVLPVAGIRRLRVA